MKRHEKEDIYLFTWLSYTPLASIERIQTVVHINLHLHLIKSNYFLAACLSGNEEIASVCFPNALQKKSLKQLSWHL